MFDSKRKFMEEPNVKNESLEILQQEKRFVQNRLDKLKRINGLMWFMSVFLTIGVPIAIYFLENRQTYYIFILYALMPFAILPSYYQRIKQYENRLQEIDLSIDIEKFKIGTEISYAEKTLRLHNNQLKKYYDLNLRQNSWIFILGICCILLGFGVIIATFYFITEYTKDDTSKIITGILGGISAIMINYIAALYLKINATVSDNLKEFHSRLVDTHKILMGNVIAAKIENRELKDYTYSSISKEICDKQTYETD